VRNPEGVALAATPIAELYKEDNTFSLEHKHFKSAEDGRKANHGVPEQVC
jgi:hypothetical protein